MPANLPQTFPGGRGCLGGQPGGGARPGGCLGQRGWRGEWHHALRGAGDAAGGLAWLG